MARHRDHKHAVAEGLKSCDHRTTVLWAADCAEHVLPYFEGRYPHDNRPRMAIEAARAWARGEMSVRAARVAAFAAHAAAREADGAVAPAAARAAGHAAATAHVAGHAAHAATYAVTAAARAADPDEEGAVASAEREWQLRRLRPSKRTSC